MVAKALNVSKGNLIRFQFRKYLTVDFSDIVTVIMRKDFVLIPVAAKIVVIMLPIFLS